MGYLLTPEERRARARAFIANKNARQEYQRALSLERANKNAEAARKAEVESKPFIVRAGASFGDVIGNVITGAVKGVEGIADIGIGAVGAVGGIFDDDFQDKMKAAISYDFAGNVVGQPLQDAFKYSLLKDDGTAEQIAQGVGQMLPAVIATIATYGAYGGFAAAGSAASAAAAANTASLITMGASAAGNATEEAFNEGANYYAGLGYGVASGLVEVGTEKLTGGLMKNVTGAGIFDGVRVSIADTGAKRFIKGAIEEGAEEMVAEAVSPALKSIYKGRKAFDAYKDAETYKNIGKAGLMGAAVSSIYGGTVNVALAKAGIGAVGKEADISESLESIKSIGDKMNRFQANDKLTLETRSQMNKAIAGNYANIEKALKSVNEDKRAKLIKKFGLDSVVDKDGTVNAQITNRLNGVINEDALPEELRQESQTIRNVIDKGVYSANLMGNESKIAQDLLGLRGQLLETAIRDADAKGVDFDAEAYAERVMKVGVADGEFTETAKAARSDLNKAINRFNNISNGDLSFVVIDGNGLVNGGLKGNVMYIAKSQLEDGQWAETVVHELTHAEEGTEEYNKMRDFLLGEDLTITEDGKTVSIRDKAFNAVKSKGYGITDQMLAEIEQKNRDGLKLTEDEQAIEDAFNNEATAHATGYLLGNKEFITQFVADESGLAEKVIARIQKLRKALSSLKSAEARKQLSMLNKAEKMYYEAAKASGNTRLAQMISGKEEEEDETVESPVKAKMSGKMSDAEFSLTFAEDIANNQRNFKNALISAEEIESAIKDTARMVEKMSKHKDILPQDKVGKTLVKNGSYDVSVENTTVCIRTLAYNAFTDMVAEELGRPLTQMESFLVSQKLYDIAKEPQCLYCYVSLDRKAYSEMIIRYISERDEAIAAWEKAGRPNVSESSQLYEDFRRNRKATASLFERYKQWITDAKNGVKLITLEDLSTETLRQEGFNSKDADKQRQYKEALKYAQSASWAKKQTQYVAYYDDILKLKPSVVKNLNSHYGLRWYSFSDYSGAFIVENMQQITDAAIRGLKGLAYTKDTDFVEIFASSGININISVYAKPNGDGTYSIDPKQSADLQKAIKLRDQYPNVGIVVVATDTSGVDWALAQEWSDVVIPFHTVRSGADVAKFYDWTVFNAEQHDVVKDENLWDAYVKSLSNPKKASKMIYPSEHQNDKATYLKLLEERGLSPRFKNYIDNPNYMKLVNETRLSEKESTPLKAKFNVEAAEASFAKFVDKGGYYEGWYNDGIDVDEEASIVAEDIKAGKMANEVDYGRQDITYDEYHQMMTKRRKVDRKHSGFDFSLPEVIQDENGNIKLKYDPFAARTELEAEKTKIAKRRTAPISEGRKKAKLADATQKRAYTKSEAERVINDIISSVLYSKSDFKPISGKNKSEAIEILWQSLNSAKDKSAVATDLANYLIDSAAVENVLQSAERSAAIETVEVLKQYLHRMNLDFLKDEIKHKFDKNNVAFARWQKRKGTTGVSPDVVAMDLAELGIIIEADNPADIFFEIDKIYTDARETIKTDVREALTDVFADNPNGLEQIRKDIRTKILELYKSGGKATSYQKLLDANNFGFWEQTNHLLASIRKIREKKLGVFFNASNYKEKSISPAINKLAGIERLGQLGRESAREICRGINEWYTPDNPLFADTKNVGEGIDTSIYRPEIKEALEAVIQGQGQLNVADMRNLLMVTEHLSFVYDHYNKVIYRGKLMDAEDLVKRFMPNIIDEPKTNSLNRIIKGYIELFQSPEVVVRFIDGYKDGFYTEMFNEFRTAATGAEVMNMTLHQPLEEFIANHKKFYEKAQNHMITYIGTHELDALQAMSLYMSLKRDQAVDGLARFGFAYEDKDGKTHRAPGFIDPETVEVPEALVNQKLSEIYEQFDDAEKEYIKIAEGLFNTVCKEIKRETDLRMKGFSNIIDGYYFPIARANIAKSVDTTYSDEMRATDASFNKNTVKNAKNELFINSLPAVIDRHLSGIAMYANMAPVIECYNMVINFNTSDSNNKVKTIRTETVNRWATAESYFRKLVADIQHIPAIKPDGTMVNANKMVGKFISAYAKSVLGANPKVMLTQMSSLFAASSVLDARSIIKGFVMSGKDVTEWSDLAALRAHNNDAVMAMGLFDKLGKVSDVLMKGIEFMDGLVVQKLFAACQVEVEAKQGHKIGTNENKIAAAKLLETVIYKTQQSALATEKSAAMRSGNAIYRIFTMFRSDAMKVQGQVITAVGEYRLAKTTYNAEKTEGNIRSLKAAKKRLTKAVAALVTSALFNALVALGFNWLYNRLKDKDEKENISDFVYDFFGNMIGGLPVISDVIDFLVSGYGFEDMQLSVVTDLLNSAKKIFSLFDRNTTGEEITASVRDLIFTASALFGIPTKNVYKFTTGVTSRIFPNVGYKIDSFFSDQPYSADLKKAIAAGDEKRVNMIAGLMLNESYDGIESASVREALRDLIAKGYNIIPRTFNGKLTIDGEAVELRRKEQIAFEKIYGIANESVETMVKYKTFQNASDSAKAKAIKNIYDIYWNLAVNDYTGEDSEDKTILMSEAIPIEKLALIKAFVAEIGADTDKDGKVISGSRKRKVQQFVASLKLTTAEKYIVMGYLGYKNTNGEDMVKRHISKLRLTAEEKKLLLKYSGYESV